MTTLRELQRAIQRNFRLASGGGIPDIAPGIPGGEHIPDTTTGTAAPNPIVGLEGDIYYQTTVGSSIIIVWEKQSNVWVQLGTVTDPNAWTSYTPTCASSIGTITTVSAFGRYKQVGVKTVLFNAWCDITTNGTGAGVVKLGLPPFTPDPAVLWIAAGICSPAGTNVAAYGLIAAAPYAEVHKYDGAYPGASGNSVYLAGNYGIA